MNRLNYFNSAERLSFAYGILTAIYIVIFCGRIENHISLLINRAVFFLAISVTVFVSRKYPFSAVKFIRYMLPFSLIIYWYPETYYLNHDVIIPNLDSIFDSVDRTLFGCSPSMEFSRILPQAFVSEIMYFGYFSYFCIFMLLFVCVYFKKPEIAESVMFYILSSFFIFYIIFIFIPVSGPQFYYPSPDNQIPDGYFFCSLMRTIQNSGEQPTGAFPSSHVGMTLISAWLLFRHFRRLFFIALPAVIALVASTVYIKAHYLIDIVAAFITAPIIFKTSEKAYSVFFSKNISRIACFGQKRHT
ncbi:MAG: phosphatase PAP2 family protein [Prevotellaceae bacterium]|jgi:membrane-associated phospholipid phosphatase|nr:phosphatase PAP2 family protein [Prevotellaceae bacterium]